MSRIHVRYKKKTANHTSIKMILDTTKIKIDTELSINLVHIIVPVN